MNVVTNHGPNSQLSSDSNGSLREMSIKNVSLPHVGTFTFNLRDPAHALACDLLESKTLARLLDVGTYGHTSAVYPGAELSRHTHTSFVVRAGIIVLESLKRNSPEHVDEINEAAPAILAVAALHDIGHIGPCSHSTWGVYFPGEPDQHEELGIRAVRQNHEIRSILSQYGEDTVKRTLSILEGRPTVPLWNKQILFGGAYNIDRHGWQNIDPHILGQDSAEARLARVVSMLLLTDKGELAIQEDGVGALKELDEQRKWAYENAYIHHHVRAFDKLTGMIVQRVRDLRAGYASRLGEIPTALKSFHHGRLERDASFSASHHLAQPGPMPKVLDARSSRELSVDTLFQLTDSVFRSHVESTWRMASDPILSRLCDTLRRRKHLPLVELPAAAKSEDPNSLQSRWERLYDRAKELAHEKHLSPKYFVYDVIPVVKNKRDTSLDPKVVTRAGEIITLGEADEHFGKDIVRSRQRRFLVVPEEIHSTVQSYAMDHCKA